VIFQHLMRATCQGPHARALTSVRLRVPAQGIASFRLARARLIWRASIREPWFGAGLLLELSEFEARHRSVTAKPTICLVHGFNKIERPFMVSRNTNGWETASPVYTGTTAGL
jgi:hypothetical protein